MASRLALAVWVAVALPLGARAATLYTSTLPPGPGESLNCAVVNASTKPVEVTIDVLGVTGTLITGGSPFTLGPGAGAGQSVGAAENPTHCRFTVEGRAKAIRGRACIQVTGGSCFAAVPAQ
jgi:hypothetical protein